MLYFRANKHGILLLGYAVAPVQDATDDIDKIGSALQGLGFAVIRVLQSVWMDVDGLWITSLWNGFGAASNTKMCI